MKKISERVSLKWRFFIYLTVFTLVMLVLLWLFEIVFLDHFYKDIKIREIKSASVEAEAALQQRDYSDALSALSAQKDVCILVATQDAYVLASEEASASCMIHKMSRQHFLELWQKAEANDGLYLIRFVMQSPKGFGDQKEKAHAPEGFLLVRLVTLYDGSRAAVLLNSVISPVDATVSTLQVLVLVIMAIMLAVALLLAFYMSRKTARPIERLNEAAKQLSEARFLPPVEGGGYREINELNITLSKAAEDLNKTEALRRELLANVSHDLRTPLTMISGYAEVMRDLPGENTPENLQVIIDETRRLTALVNDLLDLSKLQSGSAPFRPEKINLTQCIREILSRYAKLVDADGFRIVFEADTDAYVSGDELHLSQVLYNLINNAIDFTGEDKTVRIRQTVHNGTVRIEVIDSGSGIEPDKLKDIWERYYKVDKEHRRFRVGTGLGLSIARSVLEEHQARYGVESTLGKGSVFWFSLPQAE